ncbi:MAG: M14 family zinc carboxypeptidase [Aequoribacter sp.]|uniref:M14 family zinc carboxypeptidase n=1 Tax=Aequoribacter sp. TaxID=2847771 RepID=UPI003C3D8D06
MKTLFVSLALLALGFVQTIHSLAAEVKIEELINPEVTFDSSLPEPEEVIGVNVGERHWYSHEIRQYLDSLAAASPRMVALGEHARSYGGRPLVSYAISSPENLAELETIRAARAKIVNPDVDIDLSEQPAIVHMMYSIHGNEPSGSNATPLVAYYLNAAQDSELEQQLQNIVIIFNPMLNPDGLDRFANWTNNHRGLNPSADPNDREHREHTPNGRGNYYGFDLNRDWLPHQFPESRGRLALFHDWKPNVQLDFHEQGSNNHFFFMPGKPERTHPLTPKMNQILTAKIGEYHAQTLDENGVMYFTQENYDDFFMGKGSTYPDLFGTVGILFEQPSSRGTKQNTINGLLDFPTSISNQFLTSLSSIKATSNLKNELLSYQRSHFVDLRAKQPKGYYVARAEGDATRLKEFMRVLQGHNIEILGLAEDIEAEGHTFSASDSIVIPLNQPNAAYLRALWSRQLEFEENVFYDVSTWTLPLAFDLTHTQQAVVKVKTKKLTDQFLASSKKLPESKTGYLIDWRDSASAELLYDLLEAGANVRAATGAFQAQTINNGLRDFGYGSLLISPELNKDIPTQVVKILQTAASSGLPVYAAASSFTPTGIDLGSRGFEVLSLPKVLLVTGPGTSGYDTAELWHLLDRVVNMPITMIDTFRLPSTDLSRYTHVLLTDPLKAVPGISKKLDAFIQAGGVLFAQGDSTIDWLNKEGLTEVFWKETASQKLRAEFKRTAKKDSAGDLEELLPPRQAYAEADNEAAYTLVRGVILEGDIDITHPLGYGYSDNELPMFRTNNRFMLRSSDPYSTPIAYSEQALLSGYMSAENQELARESASVIVESKGKGALVLSLDDPAFRAFWWGSQRVLINSVFFGELL